MSGASRRTPRQREHPDPYEKNYPVPRFVLALVALMLAWAVYYIVDSRHGDEELARRAP